MKNDVMKSVRLGINIDHVATLRQLRAGTVDYPDIIEARNAAIDGGADQITVHLRGDRRHIQEADLEILAVDRRLIPLNLEMAASDEMINVALRVKPDIVCIVPEKREELTTEGGLDAIKIADKLKSMTEIFHKAQIRISLFIEPESRQIKGARDTGADAVEFHTGRYAVTRGRDRELELKKLLMAFDEAHSFGLAAHAGHGLDYRNTGALLVNPYLEELNIGHSIVCRAVIVGLQTAVREMKTLISGRGGL